MSNDLPYFEIPDYPESWAAPNIVARFVDGFGFRFYWATADLAPDDFQFKPSENARSIDETLRHIHSLTAMIEHILAGKSYVLRQPPAEGTAAEIRAKTLHAIQRISDKLKNDASINFEETPIKFQTSKKDLEYPFWHVLNGLLADAVYHVGQIVSFRRTLGKPMEEGVNVFLGKNLK